MNNMLNNKNQFSEVEYQNIRILKKVVNNDEYICFLKNNNK